MKEGFAVVEKIQVPSSFNAAHEVEGLIERFCEAQKVHEDYFGNVLIAVTEAFNNAVIHGNKLDAELEVSISAANKEEAFCFSVKDCGQGFDFINLPDPTAPENLEKENGRGIFLMKNLADEVEFTEGGSRVNIYFEQW